MPRKKVEPPPPVDTPFFSVSLDAEAFVWLHEMLKAKTRYTYAPKYLEMVKRTLISFDDAAKAHEPPSPNGDQPAPRKRTVPRKRARKR